MQARYAAYAADPRRRRGWAASNRGNQAIADEIAAAVLPLAAGARTIFDIGCGTGKWLERLQAAGHPAESLFGIDLLPQRTEAARTRVSGADIRAGSAVDLPWGDGTADLVTMFLVLSSMPGDAARRAALAEARRVTRPGGLLIVWEPRVPTGNRDTQRVASRLLRTELGRPVDRRSVTLLPPLARRLGPRAYGRLVRVPVLRTHRLTVWQPQAVR